MTEAVSFGVGLVIGLLALPATASIMRESFVFDTIPWRSIVGLLGLVGGGSLLTLPIGSVVLDDRVIEWFIGGWVVILVPGGFFCGSTVGGAAEGLDNGVPELYTGLRSYDDSREAAGAGLTGGAAGAERGVWP